MHVRAVHRLRQKGVTEGPFGNTGVWGHVSQEILKNKAFLKNAGGLQTLKPPPPMDTAMHGNIIYILDIGISLPHQK